MVAEAGKELQRCFALPEGKVFEPARKKQGFAINKRANEKNKKGKTLKNEKGTHVLALAVRLKCVCMYPSAPPAEVRCR